MNKIELFTAKRPLSFGFVVTFTFILLVLISSVVVNRIWAVETAGWYTGSTIGRLVSLLILLVVLVRLGWIGSAGFTRLGGARIWLILILPLIYAIAVSLYAFTGNFDLGSSDLVLANLAALFIMTHAFLEEVAFRGLVLHAFLRVRGNSNPGLIKSVLVSSIFFSGMHILYILGEPMPVVLLRIVAAFLLGILFGALVLRGGSIYPAVFFHGVLNVAGYLNLSSNAGEGTPSSWLVLSFLMIPLALYGLYLIRDLSQHSTYPESTHEIRATGKSYE